MKQNVIECKVEMWYNRDIERTADGLVSPWKYANRSAERRKADSCDEDSRTKNVGARFLPMHGSRRRGASRVFRAAE